MTTPETVKAHIRKAFAASQYPGDHRLRGSDQGDEPFEVEREFRGKRDWQSLSPEFIDRSPRGLASALSLFSHQAFRFYLPAYLIADIEGRLESSDPVFHLIHGLERSSAHTRINPRRSEDKTWREYASQRFAGFAPKQVAAIVAYLTFKRDSNNTPASTRREIDDALRGYWYERA
jgi:hypothetical protein